MKEDYREKISLRLNGHLDCEGPAIMQQPITSMFRTAARPSAHLITMILKPMMMYRTTMDYNRVGAGHCTLIYVLQPVTCWR
jgi:hypothetical protein